MSMNETKKMPSWKLSCMSWEGMLLSIAIIAIRAFQANAQPIESWSALSWCLMLVPAVFPLLLWIALVFLWFIGYVLATTFSKS